MGRFLISSDCHSHFPWLCQKILQRPISDHFPICLASDGIKWGPVPFKFGNKWLKVKSLLCKVENWWKETVVTGKASYRVSSKLKMIKEKIKMWAKEEGRREETKV